MFTYSHAWKHAPRPIRAHVLSQLYFKEDYHLSRLSGINTTLIGLTTLGDYHLLQRIITSPLVGLHSQLKSRRVTCCPYLEYFVPYSLPLVYFFIFKVSIMDWEHKLQLLYLFPINLRRDSFTTAFSPIFPTALRRETSQYDWEAESGSFSTKTQ